MIARMGTAGACKAIVKALAKNTGNDQVCKWCLMAICSLSSQDSLRLGFLNSKVSEALSNALSNHCSVEATVEWGCKAIHQLSMQDGALVKLRQAGICETVTQAMQVSCINS